MRIFLSSVLLGLTLSIATPLSAQTIDGKKPPTGGHCDDLVELTSDLHRLCLAYCEPKFLELVDLEKSDTGKQESDIRILESYRKKMQPGDPDMPCVQQSCPCWTKEELHTVFPVGTTCSDHEGPKRNVVRLRYHQPSSNASSSSALSEQHLGQFKHFCIFRDRQSETGLSRSLQITESEFIGCAVSIKGFAERLGLECDDDSGYK